ncbi:hypothetical protein ACT8ZV_20210 [Nocardioides sp. MAHUQ-72]|uniref:hypothetical protein n=1 Tax=unclassified Nocardioides TaxID=2615069 RepID=UPI00360E8866
MSKRALLSVVAAAAAVSALVGTPAPATAGAEHGFVPEDYDAAEHFAAGEGLCVPWAGTFHEVRHGGYRAVTAPGGQQPGEVHVNGAVDGLVELIPDDTALPTYTGTYREKVDGIFLGTTPEGDDLLRVAQFRLRSTLRGTDGSTYTLRGSGKVTLNAHGELVVDREQFTCA